MHLLARVTDKLLFAILLLTTLQVPILADHYRQYLSGFYDAQLEQVTAIEQLARDYNYNTVDALLESLAQNSNPVVREDARNKASAIARLREVETGLDTLTHGAYYQQAWYMLSPSRKNTLLRVLDNFSPSVPLSPEPVVFSILFAILLNVLVWAPFWMGKHCYCWLKHRRQRIKFG